AGDYICRAENNLGIAEATIQVDIGKPPEIQRNMNSTQVYIGTNISLCCIASGYPEPNIHWSKLKYGGVQKNSLNNTLTITDAKLEDAGLYICTAENIFGSDSAMVDIGIIGLVKPVIQKDYQQSTRKVIPGENITLVCKLIEGTPSPKLAWFKDGRQLNLKPSIYLNGEPDELVLVNVSPQNVGNYECRATNVAGTDSNSFQVQLIESPTFKDRWTSYREVIEGSLVELPCRAQGDATLTYSWMVEGKPINDSSKWYVAWNNSLIINRVAEEDTNSYTCIVSNPAGSASKKVQMKVLVPPFFKDTQDETVTVVVNHVVNISCAHSGVPTPEFNWYKDDILLHNVQSQHMTLGSAVSDRGVYTCVVTNKAGEISRKVNFTVLSKKPVIQKDYQQTARKVIPGENITLVCKLIEGTPSPKLAWFKDGRQLNLPPSTYLNGEPDELVLVNVNPQNVGNYECRATNVAGTDSNSFQVQLIESPTFKDRWTSYREVIEGSLVELPCRAQGDATLTYSWMVEGKPINDSSKWYVAWNNSLIINRVAEEDTNSYTCIVSNPAGSASKKVQMKVLVPPFFKDTQDETVTVVVNHVVNISCAHSGVPTPEFSWYKDDILLHNVQSQHMTLGSAVSERGVYTCVVTNKAGEISRKVNFTVLKPPTIDEHGPEKISVVQGKSVSLFCISSGYPTPKISWHSSIPTLLESSQIRFMDNELRIINASSNMSSRITCDAENVVGVDHKSFQLEVLVPPKILDNGIASNVTLKQGEDFSIPCLATGTPSPEISWHTSPNIVRQGYHDDVMWVLTDNTLVLTRVSSKTGNEFSCIASNAAGTDTRNYSITIEENSIYVVPSDPKIHTKNVLESEDLTTLDCDVDENTKVDKWLKDNSSLDMIRMERADEVKISYSNNKKSMSLLEIHTLHAGIYQCLDDKGNIISSFKVNVLSPPLFDVQELPHEIKITTDQGSFVTMNCSANGFPKPIVTWKKIDLPEHLPVTEHTIPDIRFDPEPFNYALEFPKVQTKHSGKYQCTASNLEESDHDDLRKTRIFILEVFEPPFIREPLEERMKTQENSEVTLMCDVEGNPSPEVVWYRNGLKIDPAAITTNETHSKENNNFRVMSSLYFPRIEPTDDGKVSCFATNKLGVTEKVFHIDVSTT
ncbi:hypothetical protein WDU94_009646, partial [Cyamophila willieti]